MKKIPMGTIVIVEAPGSRGDEGDVRMLPAIVMKQWDDGQLQLFSFHFEGSFLMNAVPLSRCYHVGASDPIEKERSYQFVK